MSWAFLPFKRYFDFKGRSRRKEYWYFYLLNCSAFLLVYFLFETVPDELFDFVDTLAAIGFLFIIIPSLSLQVRRFHDTGRSGWQLLFALVPFVGQLLIFFINLENSQPFTNKYGPNPKETTITQGEKANNI